MMRVVLKSTCSPEKNESPDLSARNRTLLSGIAQVARFLVSGGFATFVHWAVMGLLVMAGVLPVVATIIGSLIGAIVNYFLQFYWSFSGRAQHGKSVPAYLFTVVLGGLLNAGLFHLMTAYLALNMVLAQLLATVVVAVMNFIIYKRIVFYERSIRTLAP